MPLCTDGFAPRRVLTAFSEYVTALPLLDHPASKLNFSSLLMLNSQGSGLDVLGADLETDEDLVSASNTRGHCDVQRLADDGRRLALPLPYPCPCPCLADRWVSNLQSTQPGKPRWLTPPSNAFCSTCFTLRTLKALEKP